MWRPLATILAALVLALPATAAAADPPVVGSVTTYVDPSQLTALSFGDRSHWLQPWRAYLDTWPGTRMLDSIGMNFNVGAADAPATAHLLADSGFRQARISEPWGMVDYGNPGVLTNDSDFRTTLAALKQYGLRPLIVLEAPDYLPCPMRTLNVATDRSAAKGATQIHLTAAAAAAVAPGRSGLDTGPGIFGETKRAGNLITAVSADGTATLSKPLDAALPAGSHAGTTLRYLPFAHPSNPDFESTLAGWLDYARTVTRTARSVLGSDAFDIEIWNELAYASDFLDVNTYYASPVDGGSGSTTDSILARTVAALRDPSSGVSGIGIGDGFANQNPRPSGATEPPGLTAIDKHPYPYSGMRRFPSSAQVDSTRPLDAHGNVDGFQDSSGNWHESFTPNYDSFEPEYYLTAQPKFRTYYQVLTIDLDNVVRDMSPVQTLLNGAPHSRDLHPPGAAAPQTWVTEINMNPAGAPSAGFTSGDRLHFQTKVALRSLVAYAGKGATAVDLFGVTDSALGLVPQSFFDKLHQTGTYPGDAAGGEVMDSVRRLVSGFAGATAIAQPRSLTLDRIDDFTGNQQFAGDGTAAHPPLFDRDVLAFFPFQVTDSRFVIPVYVMTTNLGKNYKPAAPSSDPTRFDMPAETFRLTIGGVDGRAADLSATDPLTGAKVPVDVTGRAPGSVTISLPVTDSPRLLTLQGPPGQPETSTQRLPTHRTSLTLGRLVVHPRAFNASARGGSISRLTGAEVSYSLSGPALASFRVERYVRRGRRHRYVRVRGHFSHGSQAGINRFQFTGRIKHRPLAPGRYRLVAVASNNAGQTTATRTASFRVLG
jgi:hypothetical protein